MPTTEAPLPSSPPPTEPPPRARRGRSSRSVDYDKLEGYDLLHVIEDLEDERSRLALREKIWIALIFHLLLFGYLVFAPKYIWHVKVRDASVALRDKPPVFLDLPPDALKQLKPKTQAPLSDKNRQQQSPKPTLDRKTLEQLQAMRRAGPPAPKPAPPTQQPPAPAPPQVAQQAPPAPKPEPAAPPPVAPSQSAQIEAPKPQPTRPNFSTGGPPNASEAAQQAARQGHVGAGTYSGDMGANAPSQHPGDKGAVDVLSDTLGVDFGPYIQRVIYDTKRSWYPIIPEVAQPPISRQGKVLIRFKILPDGSVKEMHLEGPSGDVSLDRAAWGGITGASPYPPLPKNFKGPFLELRFYFLYNDNAGIR